MKRKRIYVDVYECPYIEAPIGNCYGSPFVFEHEGRYYMGIENWDVSLPTYQTIGPPQPGPFEPAEYLENTVEIPKRLYTAWRAAFKKKGG